MAFVMIPLLFECNTVLASDDTDTRDIRPRQNRLYFMTTGLNFRRQTFSIDLSIAEFPRFRYSPTTAFQIELAWYPVLMDGEVGLSISPFQPTGFYQGTTLTLWGGYFGRLEKWCGEECVEFYSSELDRYLEIQYIRSSPYILRSSLATTLRLAFIESHASFAQVYFWSYEDNDPEKKKVQTALFLQFGVSLHILSERNPGLSLIGEATLRLGEALLGRSDVHALYYMIGPRLQFTKLSFDLAASIDPDRPGERYQLDTQTVFARISYQF